MRCLGSRLGWISSILIGVVWISSPVWSITVDHVVEKSDALLVQPHTDEINEQAVKILRASLRDHGPHYETLWRLARAYYIRGWFKQNESTDDFATGLSYANRAIKLEPKGVDALVWFGNNTWMLNRKRNQLSPQKWKAAKDAKLAYQTALRQDPTQDRIYYWLARLHRETIPVFSLGDLKKARKNILKAIQYNTNSPRHYLEYGIICMELRDWRVAESALSTVIKMANEPDRYLENEYEKELAQLNLTRVQHKLDRR